MTDNILILVIGNGNSTRQLAKLDLTILTDVDKFIRQIVSEMEVKPSTKRHWRYFTPEHEWSVSRDVGK